MKFVKRTFAMELPFMLFSQLWFHHQLAFVGNSCMAELNMATKRFFFQFSIISFNFIKKLLTLCPNYTYNLHPLYFFGGKIFICTSPKATSIQL